MKNLIIALVASTFSFAAMADGHAAWWKKAGAPYAGTVLQGVAENTPPGQYAGEVSKRIRSFNWYQSTA